MVQWYQVFYKSFVFLRKSMFGGRVCDVFTDLVELPRRQIPFHGHMPCGWTAAQEGVVAGCGVLHCGDTAPRLGLHWL